jgi:hypothetical protein
MERTPVKYQFSQRSSKNMAGKEWIGEEEEKVLALQDRFNTIELILIREKVVLDGVHA